MLTYYFENLKSSGYKNLCLEESKNTSDLLASILKIGISLQLKRGLGKEYILQTDESASLRGKIEIVDSIKKQSMINNKWICTYDDFSINNKINKIIKSTLKLLMKQDISKKNTIDLHKLVIYFNNVEYIDLSTVDWNIKFNRGNQSYRFIISVCYLAVKGLLYKDDEGYTRAMDYFNEETMNIIFEKFILNYYKKNYSYLETSIKKFKWSSDESSDGIGLLPEMRTDICIEHKESKKKLIIEAKYYKKILKKNLYGDKEKLSSSHLYQIYSYIKAYKLKTVNATEEITGLLLYAKTDKEVALDYRYELSGEKVEVKTLDLSLEFNEVEKQLDSIVHSTFKGNNECFANGMIYNYLI